MRLDLTNKLSVLMFLLLPPVLGKVQVETNFTKSSAGKLSMIGDGSEGCVIF